MLGHYLGGALGPLPKSKMLRFLTLRFAGVRTYRSVIVHPPDSEPIPTFFVPILTIPRSVKTRLHLAGRYNPNPDAQPAPIFHFLVPCGVLPITSRAAARTCAEADWPPHPYYFREMYLPQLTTGPGSVAWSADSKAVVYSMAGSLWQQNVQSDSAIQLTVGPGYDYQPDWSHDGRWIVYARYDRDMVALWALDTVTMQGKG